MRVDRDTLNQVQRVWPLRVVKRLKRSATVVLAVFRWAAWHIAYAVARQLVNAAATFQVVCDDGMKRAWYVVRPFDLWGGAENYLCQRQYDGLFYDYETMNADERNAMIVEYAAPVRGLRKDASEGCERAN